jgi:EAL domain-containing protein (putative c-di-GMP-specific phosphodiesterase class I)
MSSPAVGAYCELGPVGSSTGSLFVTQPIVRTGVRDLFAREILYRGNRPTDWRHVDGVLLRYLAENMVSGLLWVNISNQTLDHVDEELVTAACAHNNLIIEWSESVSDDAAFSENAKAINRLVSKGVRFAVDDVGAGRDGLQRIAEMDSVYAVKVDGAMFQRSRESHAVCDLLGRLVSWCRQNRMMTVAEWVESEVDYRLACDMGFDLVQGMYFGDLCLLGELTEPLDRGGPGVAEMDVCLGGVG